MTLLDLLDASVAERGAASAVNDVSYDELAAGILRVARGLRERGLQSGDRIALFCENRLGVYVRVPRRIALGRDRGSGERALPRVGSRARACTMPTSRW